MSVSGAGRLPQGQPFPFLTPGRGDRISPTSEVGHRISQVELQIATLRKDIDTQIGTIRDQLFEKMRSSFAEMTQEVRENHAASNQRISHLETQIDQLTARCMKTDDTLNDTHDLLINILGELNRRFGYMGEISNPASPGGSDCSRDMLQDLRDAQNPEAAPIEWS